MDEEVYCKNCEYFDGWLDCNVPILDGNAAFGFYHWYSSNKNDYVIRYSCNTQNKNNDCDQYVEKKRNQ